MQSDTRFFDDLARLANGAMGTLTGMRSEVEALFTQRLERMVSDLNLVTREEFDVVEALAQKAREENAELAARLDALETKDKIKTKPKNDSIFFFAESKSAVRARIFPANLVARLRKKLAK